MPKIFLSFILIFNSLNYKEITTQVENIEYYSNNYDNTRLKLDIEIYAKIRDVVELKVYICNENKQNINEDYYSNSLSIVGRKHTIANIPIKLINKMYLNIIVYSSNFNKEIENIMFPVYPKEKEICDLDFKRVCNSKYPSKVVFTNKQIEEVHEKIGIVTEKLDLYATKNLLPLNKIKLITNIYNDNEGEAFLILTKKVKEMNLDYNNGYVFNLNLKEENGIINFEIMDNFYLDLFNGKTSEKYIEKGLYINNIVFPYIDEEYEFYIEINDKFISYNLVKFSFRVNTSKKLVGKCNESKYCFRRIFL